MENKIEIGAVAKPQGIKGELKIRLFADGFDSVKGVTEVEISSVVYKVENFRYAGGEEAIMKVAGIDDRNFAETLRRCEVYAKRSEIKLEEGRYFITDLIGLNVVTEEGEIKGKITDITEGRTDIITIQKEGKIARFPFLKDLLLRVDLENGEFIVSDKRFLEVTVYED